MIRAMVIRLIVVVLLCVPALMPAGADHAVAASPLMKAPTWQVLVAANSQPRLSHPEGLAIDLRGHSLQKWMYLADTGHNRIVKLGTGGHYLGSWGSRGAGPGKFVLPAGAAVDGHGNVYVADSGNNRIQKFDSQGHFLAQWGTAGTEPGQFSGPAAVAVGGSGNVFVADRNNKRIEKFSPMGHLLAVWPVTIPVAPNPNGFGPVGPYALTVGSSGKIYTAVDTGQCSGGHCVMDYIALETLSPSGKITRIVVGGNPYGRFSYPAVPGVTSVLGPWWQIGALIVDSQGHVFLGEWNASDRTSVTELSTNAKVLGQWQLPPPSGLKGWPPQGMALDPRGNVYVADTIANRVLKLVFRP
ncbi:MAG TPA: NHL repeat-containing protein [Chloroflexota bacterium]